MAVGLLLLQLSRPARDTASDTGSGLVTGLISAPFIINNFVAAEIAQAVLPNW